MAFRRFRRKRTTPTASNIHVDAGVNPQRYDPDLIVLDPGADLVSRDRLQRGYGAPPVVAYAQGLIPNFGGTFRDTLEQFIPMLKNLPRLKDVISPPQ